MKTVRTNSYGRGGTPVAIGQDELEKRIGELERAVMNTEGKNE